MVFSIYNVKDANNVIEKTLANEQSIDIVFLDAQNVQSPIVRVKKIDAVRIVTSFNYAYIPSLKRYYFIDGATMLLGGLAQLVLNCDYLMTYKDAILKASGFITGAYSDNAFDRNRYEEQDIPTVSVKTFDNPFASDKSFVLVTAV